MEINVIDQLKEIVHAFGLNCALLDKDSNWDYEWDSRLYRAVGMRIVYDDNIKNGLALCQRGTMYSVRDRFDSLMIVFLYEGKLISIGPFLTESTEEILPYVIEKNKIDEAFHEELREIYNTFPVISAIDALEDIIIMHMKYLFPEEEVCKVHLHNIQYSTTMFDELQQAEEDRQSMDAIAARYKIEERFMNAVSSGEYEKVIEVTKEFNNYRMSPRSADEIRNMKNSLVVLNTLLRRAVQNAQVHPAHIDRLSSNFAKRIEVATKSQEIVNISREMPRKYCLLVTNYSLEGYSKMIQDTLNYIDFNLIEDLSLNAIADRINVNGSHLSKQFKKEVGKTLTDYVNEKRVTTTLKYLATTELPIQSIAEMVGIYDENYYSRLFKKYQNTTPTKYRKLMKNE